MILLDARLELLIADEPAWLRVPEGNNESRSFVGRYIHINERPFALGRELGRGEEAIVFELIDLRTGDFPYVAKVCRHRPGTKPYQRWALPLRLQRNPASFDPDIELFPCILVPIPGGGVVKVQRYFSSYPATDWLSQLPITPVVARIAERKYSDAEALLDTLISEHGEHAILLEFKGRFAFAKDQLDEALEWLTRALASHIVAGSSSRYGVALCLAQVMEAIYARDRSHGTGETSITLKDGTVLRNTFFDPSTNEAALDDSLQDRPLFVLLEVMSDLPYFVGGLNFMQQSLLDLTGGDSFKNLSEAVASIDPGNPMLLKLRESGIWPSESDAPASEVNGTSNQEQAPIEDENPNVTIPPDFWSSLQQHDAAYNPETKEIRKGQARVAAAISDIKRGREQEAEASLKEAISIEPDVVDHRIALATFLSSRGRDDEAIQILSETIRQLQGYPIVRLVLGSMLLRSGKLEEAEHTLLRAKPLLLDHENEIRLLMMQISERKRML